MLIFAVCRKLDGTFKGLKNDFRMVLNFFGVGGSKAENGAGMIVAIG